MMMSMHRAAALLLAVGLSLIPAGPLAAQIDYRNLDRERPVATEDAYPVERHAFELLLPLRTERERGGDRLHLIPLEVEYGIFDNTQVGVGLPIASLEEAGSDAEWGLAGLGIFGLYNFNTESPLLPALSLGADVTLPVGSLAGDDARLSLRVVATRSWGLTRLHFNATRGLGSEDRPGVEFLDEPLPPGRIFGEVFALDAEGDFVGEVMEVARGRLFVPLEGKKAFQVPKVFR